MLETERLLLHPLTPAELRLWLEDMPALEEQLDTAYHAEPLEGVFREIVKNQYQIALKDPGNYLFHSFWFLIRKSDRKTIGAADFKDRPNINGEVEIGYGLGPEFTGRGYMTEAVSCLCSWALTQEDIRTVIAETEINGIPSHRVLLRCGFTPYRQHATLWWRLPAETDNPGSPDNEY